MKNIKNTIRQAMPSLLNWVNQVANGQIENRGLVLTANSWYYGYYFTVDRVELEVE